MLILARYLDEALFIGKARVTILEVTRRKHGRLRVKLGIEAPPDISILRAELPRLETQGEDSTVHHQADQRAQTSTSLVAEMMERKITR